MATSYHGSADSLRVVNNSNQNIIASVNWEPVWCTKQHVSALPLSYHELHKTRAVLCFFCQKKWLLDIVQVNFMYFTHEEAETQILHKYTVVWLQSLCFFNVLSYSVRLSQLSNNKTSTGNHSPISQLSIFLSIINTVSKIDGVLFL